MGYRTSTIKRGRKQKLGSSMGTIAISLGRQKNDPAYKRMIKYKALYKQSKTQLKKKYASKSRSLATQMASKHKYENFQPKLYKQFLEEQRSEILDAVLDKLKEMAWNEKRKIDLSCDRTFLGLGEKTKLEKKLCHINGKVAYFKILINGLRSKISECKNYKCKEKFKSLLTIIHNKLQIVIKQKEEIHQEIQK